MNIFSHILKAKELIRWDEVLKICEALEWKYSTPKGRIKVTKKELEDCLNSVCFAAETSFYKKLQAGEARPLVYVSSGGWSIWICFFSDKEPTVKITFGI